MTSRSDVFMLSAGTKVGMQHFLEVVTRERKFRGEIIAVWRRSLFAARLSLCCCSCRCCWWCCCMPRDTNVNRRGSISRFSLLLCDFCSVLAACRSSIHAKSREIASGRERSHSCAAAAVVFDISRKSRHETRPKLTRTCSWRHRSTHMCAHCDWPEFCSLARHVVTSLLCQPPTTSRASSRNAPHNLGMSKQ